MMSTHFWAIGFECMTYVHFSGQNETPNLKIDPQGLADNFTGFFMIFPHLREYRELPGAGPPCWGKCSYSML